MNIYLRLLIINILLLFVALSFSPVYGHIEAEMPDPIAEVEYQMMLDFEPDDIETRYKLAMVYYRLKKITSAETELNHILDNNPNYFHALEGLGMLRLQQKQYKAAVESLEKAILLPKSESGTFFYLGLSQLGLKNTSAAKNAFTTGLIKCQAEPESDRAIPLEQFKESLAEITTASQ